jgi:hypothetical protein
MKMKTSEFLDRLTILTMKSRFDEKSETEFMLYLKELETLIKTDQWNTFGNILILSLIELSEANAKIWVTESAIRKEFDTDPESKQELDYDEIGKRAIMIREYNKIRLSARERIDQVFGEVSDTKVDHVSGK